MKFFKANLYKLFLISFLVVMPVVSFAQSGTINPGSQGGTINPGGQSGTINPGGCNPAGGKLCNPISSNTVQEFIQKILEGVLKIGLPLVALAIIYCGFLFVSARGNSEKLGKAKDALLYTVIGAAILMGSWAIAKLITETVLAL